MPHRITITVTGIVTLPTVTGASEPRDTDLIDVIAMALAEHYPEFKADPEIPVVAVQVEEISQ